MDRSILKRNAVDFLCAFAVFAIILLSIVLVCNEDFADGAIRVDKEQKSVEIFGTELVLNPDMLKTAQKLVKFNDNIFGGGFSGFIMSAAEFILSYIGDFLRISFGIARLAVGAE